MERRRRIDQALFAVVMEAYLHGVSTRKVDDLASGIMLAVMAFSFTALTDASTVIPDNQKQTIATAMEDNAQIVSDTQLQQLLAAEPQPVQSEIVAINDQPRSLSLQVAMLVPVLACLFGFINAFRMVRLPDIEPSAAHEGIDFG